MKKINETVKKETLYIALSVFILSVFMQAVFLIIKKWDYTVLLGNALGYIGTVLNFFLMALTVQSAVEKEEKEAKNALKVSQALRLLMLFVILVICFAFKCFNIIAVILPLFFTRIAIFLRSAIVKKKGNDA